MVAAGYLPDSDLSKKTRQTHDNMVPMDDVSHHNKIASSIFDDPELIEFWNALKEREDLQIKGAPKNE